MSRTVTLKVTDDATWYPTEVATFSPRRWLAIRLTYFIGLVFGAASVAAILTDGPWVEAWLAGVTCLLIGEQLSAGGWRLAYRALGVATACYMHGVVDTTASPPIDGVEAEAERRRYEREAMTKMADDGLS